VHVGDWKMTRNAKNAWQLFNFEKDPSEMNDLATSSPETVKTLDVKWQVWANRVNMKTTALKTNSDNTIKFEVYPNPIKGMLNIKYESLTDSNYSINIFNSLNQKVYTSKLQGNSTTINLSNRGLNGIYLVQLLDEKGFTLESKKIIIQ
jgi:hypothetical protein